MPTIDKKTSGTITVRFPLDIIKLLEATAFQQGRTINAIVTDIVTKELRHETDTPGYNRL